VEIALVGVAVVAVTTATPLRPISRKEIDMDTDTKNEINAHTIIDRLETFAHHITTIWRSEHKDESVLGFDKLQVKVQTKQENPDRDAAVYLNGEYVGNKNGATRRYAQIIAGWFRDRIYCQEHRATPSDPPKLRTGREEALEIALKHWLSDLRQLADTIHNHRCDSVTANAATTDLIFRGIAATCDQIAGSIQARLTQQYGEAPR